jgi:hypothetical protein
LSLSLHFASWNYQRKNIAQAKVHEDELNTLLKLRNIFGIFGTKAIKYEIFLKERHARLLANNRC